MVPIVPLRVRFPALATTQWVSLMSKFSISATSLCASQTNVCAVMILHAERGSPFLAGSLAFRSFRGHEPGDCPALNSTTAAQHKRLGTLGRDLGSSMHGRP